MKDNLEKTKKQATAYIIGTTDESTKDGGTTGNSTVWGFTKIQAKAKSSTDFGSTGRELLGSTPKLLVKSMTSSTSLKMNSRNQRAKPT